jgi:hypothetical protein
MDARFHQPTWSIGMVSAQRQVEWFLALITERRTRGGAHRSAASLTAAITGFIDRHDEDISRSHLSE